MRKDWITVLPVFCLMCLWASSAAVAADVPPLVDLQQEIQPVKDHANPTVTASAPIQLDKNLLWNMRPGDMASVRCFNRTLYLVFNETRPNGGWTGYVSGQPLATFHMARVNGTVSLLIRHPEHGQCHIRTGVDGTGELLEIDLEKYPSCQVKNIRGRFLDDGIDAIPVGACDDGSVIDVMVLYTPVARDAMGSSAAIETEITLAVDATNLSYENTTIPVELRLVHVGEVNYMENGSYSSHLTRLSGTEDGYMDEVHALRDSIGADLVALIVDDGQYCGIAYLMPDNTPEASGTGFSVTSWFCAVGNLTFAHELGHNMGCCHARGDGGGCNDGGLFNYSVGHRYNGDSGTLWRSVMAYSPGNRITQFSNPDVFFDGQPTGVPLDDPLPSHNGMTIDVTRFSIANYRCSTAICDNAGLSTPMKYDTGSRPVSIRLADMNDDGFVDGITVNQLDDTVSVLFNNHTGGLSQVIHYDSGSYPVDVQVANLNDDNFPDIIVSNFGDNQLSVLLNNGDKTFQAPYAVGAGAAPWGVAAGDLDNDGDTDLAVAAFSDDAVRILMNDGSGNFSLQPGSIAAGDGPVRITLTHLNNDNKLDFAAACFNSNQMAFSLNNGDGTFAPATLLAAGIQTRDVLSGDFNVDGHNDVAVVNRLSGTLSVYAGDGIGGLTFVESIAVGPEIESARPIDVNVDGFIDIAVASDGSSAAVVLLNDGVGTFDQHIQFQTGNRPLSLDIGDLNNDGAADIAVANRDDDDVSVVINQANPCIADLIGDDGLINAQDLLELLLNWGECPPITENCCDADFDESGIIDVADLLILISDWGNCL